MAVYEILHEDETLEVVGFIVADTLAEAEMKAYKRGYRGESYRVEEAVED